MFGESLSNHFEEWKNMTNNKCVLDWIKNGVPLDLQTIPPQFEEKNGIFKQKRMVI